MGVRRLTVLSDHERATLSEIQCQFLAEDPRYVRSFETPRTAAPPRTPHGRPEPIDEYRLAYTVLMWIATTLSALWLIAGSLGGAFLIGLVAVTFFLVRRREVRTRTPSA